ncbi:hypothetical protein CGLAR1_12585 [Corynebacterium glutamicum]|uniref:hypothetical protein n=1 Tax=Corynebacterium glutamicum TaxID=1718 RepID=UPI0004F8E2CF|nr:hypothetical protein [Corynebacterium glutamicum]AIK86038.1 hypothetical protein CGLAR1_12585 [Corynebacterium glutamicum]AIK88821.1 hypothetical protein AR0_12720 [Corynebacterium glutamicum]
MEGNSVAQESAQIDAQSVEDTNTQEAQNEDPTDHVDELKAQLEKALSERDNAFVALEEKEQEERAAKLSEMKSDVSTEVLESPDFGIHLEGDSKEEITSSAERVIEIIETFKKQQEFQHITQELRMLKSLVSLGADSGELKTLLSDRRFLEDATTVHREEPESEAYQGRLRGLALETLKASSTSNLLSAEAYDAMFSSSNGNTSHTFFEEGTSPGEALMSDELSAHM